MRRMLALSLSLVFALAVGACQEDSTSPVGSDDLVPASHGKDAVRVVPVELKEINDSGITGEATITDDGTSIVVSGTAEGMRPGASFDYLSLYYDKASPPKGPEACQPGTFDPNHPLFLTDPQMLGGTWIVDSNGDGTLLDLVGDYVPVGMVGTISIRDLDINSGNGPEAVVACGKVTHGPAR